MHEIFSEDRKDKHRAAKRIKCQASDGLSLVLLTVVFINRVLRKLGVANKVQCDAFIAFARSVELIQCSAKSTVTPAQLLQAVELFLELFAEG